MRIVGGGGGGLAVFLGSTPAPRRSQEDGAKRVIALMGCGLGTLTKALLLFPFRTSFQGIC